MASIVRSMTSSLLSYDFTLTILLKRFSSLGPKQSNALALMRWYKENNHLYGPLLRKEKKKLASENVTEYYNYIPEPQLNVGLSDFEESAPLCNVDAPFFKKISHCDAQPKIEYVETPDNYHTEVETPDNYHTEIQKHTLLDVQLDLIERARLNEVDDEELSGLKDMLVNKALINVPSVSRILNATRSAENEMILQRWKQKMIKQMGEDGFKQYQEDILKRGVNFHTCLQSLLSGTPVIDIELAAENRGNWDSIQNVLGNVEDVRLLESRVTHPHLQYSGQFDCVATYTRKNAVCLIDWKTSQKPKPFLSSTYDNPLQAVAYIGALNHDNQYDMKVTSALIVIAYNDGTAAHAHFMDESTCVKYWSQWLKRLRLYWSQVLSQT